MAVNNFDPYQKTQESTPTSTAPTAENDPLSVFESSVAANTGDGGTTTLLNNDDDFGSGFQELSIDDGAQKEAETIEETEENLLELDGYKGDKTSAEAASAGGKVGIGKDSGMWAYALNNDGGASRQQVNGGEIPETGYASVNGGGKDAEQYGIEDDGSNVNNGGMNNNRPGLFSRWSSSRNASQSDGANGEDFLDEKKSAPAWSNASNKSAKDVGGGGIFGRRVSNDVDDAAPTAGEGGITGDGDLNNNSNHHNALDEDDEIVDAELEEEQDMDNLLRPGDHIYVWQSYGINPRAYQRHAVVYSVTRSGDSEPSVKANMATLSDYEQQANDPLAYDSSNIYNENYYDDLEVTVVSFYHFQRHQAHGAAIAQNAASGSRRGKRSGCKRELLIDFLGPDAITKKKPIHKVHYGRQVKKGLLSQKASVGTALKKDATGLILARVTYLLEHQDHLPDHNALSANGECAAMWCVTGRWCTLQGASILQITSVGQAGGALLAGGILSNITVLVPMPGLWGAAGWWWYVPTTVAYPFLVPMLVAFGMCSLVPLEILRRNRKKWRGITDGLNHEFWVNADPEVKDKFFGLMATAEKEAEMRSFFGVRENDTSAEDSRYMPLGGAPGGIDDDDEEDEVAAMQKLEQSCANMDVDLSGKPPERSRSSGSGGWGSFMGSFRRKEPSTGSQSLRDMQKQGDWEMSEKERQGIIS